MRLISPFRDFYDGAQGADRERTPIFLRTQTEELVRPGDLRRMAALEPFTSFADKRTIPWLTDFDDVGVEAVRLAFCGKAFFFYGWYNRLFVTSMELEEFVRQLPAQAPGRKRLLEAFQGLQVSRGFHPLGGPRPTAREWERCGPKTTDMPAELFRQEGTPILSWGSQLDALEAIRVHGPGHGRWSGSVLVKNPSLQAIGLRGVWSAGWIWQELDMYLSNQMATQVDPPIARTDELVRDAHGFDASSFRSAAPGDRKARRARRKSAP